MKQLIAAALSLTALTFASAALAQTDSTPATTQNGSTGGQMTPGTTGGQMDAGNMDGGKKSKKHKKGKKDKMDSGMSAPVQTMDMNGKKTVIVTKDASADDFYRARWAFYNADKREVKRFKAMGFSDADFKAICNIALQTGLSTDYIARQIKEVGRPYTRVAADFGVPINTIMRDIPGYGATSFGVETKDDTGSMNSGMSGGSMGSGSTMPTTPSTPTTPTTPMTPSTPAPSTP